MILNKISLYFGLQYKPSSGAEWKKMWKKYSTQPLRKVCIANRNIGQFCFNNLVHYSVLFNFGHIRRWDQCALYILDSTKTYPIFETGVKTKERFRKSLKKWFGRNYAFYSKKKFSKTLGYFGLLVSEK